MKNLLVSLACIWVGVFNLHAQNNTHPKQRLDFARMYLEVGTMVFPSFTGKQLINSETAPIDYSTTLNPYLTWGAFHFWGHTEFYVSFPLGQFTLTGKDAMHQLSHSVPTGARVYPWAMKEGKIRPYLGANWSSLTFQHLPPNDENYTAISKDFMLNFDAGILYNYKKVAFRMALNYFTDTQWQYPLSKTQLTTIKTPSFTVQMGLLYAFDVTKNNASENVNEWNSYPTTSKLSYQSQSFGDLFLGAGPSQSFSLAPSNYNTQEFPYLQQKLPSSAFIDFAIGYHFNRANIFTALSFRNPVFTTEGFGTQQTIRKKSLALEVNKFLTDYSGFAPYLGLNIAYDQIEYMENENGIEHREQSSSFEPGITLGWDIVPGKTQEAFVLRTNLRWYPFTNFKVEGIYFNFSQLEYNLIQLVFYPQRLSESP